MRRPRYFCPILMRLEFSRHVFQKVSNSDFIKICPVGTELFHGDGRTDGQTDTHDEAYTGFSQFCKRIDIFMLVAGNLVPCTRN
jgi:hypothetical protein